MQKRCIYVDEFDLIRPENIFKATFCCSYFSSLADYKEIIKYLHPQEHNYYNTLKHEKRIRSYLMGRFVAKKAVAALSGKENLTNIYIQPGIFTQPIVVSDKQNIQVSITHCDDFGAGLAFPEAHPMGIDLEKISHDKRYVLERQITKAEKELISSCPFSYMAGLTLLWTVKEALSKVLKTGLMTPFEVFEISKIELYDEYAICYYQNFTQYKAISFTVYRYMCSIVHPLKTKIQLDIPSFKKNFAFIESLNEVEITVL